MILIFNALKVYQAGIKDSCSFCIETEIKYLLHQGLIVIQNF